jgi:hypothetical protein
VTSSDEITGLWRRSLVRWPDGRSDTTTSVRWMQTRTLFVDLRQPADRPRFDGVHCLHDLGRDQIEWLALQAGFAGELRWDGHHVEWRRQFDFRPTQALPDEGRLWFEGSVMIEEGRHSPYVEHWHRDVPSPRPCAGVALRDASTGQAGMLVRAGDGFMYARARAIGLPPQAELPRLVGAAATKGEILELIDCEISFGSVGAGTGGAAVWRIEHSTLPFKEGQLLQPLPGREGEAGPRGEAGPQGLRTRDMAAGGEPLERRWVVTGMEGSAGELI